MGKKDTITKEYMRDPVVFADAFNKYLYHGEQVIRPEQLRELDTTEIAIPYGSDGASIPEQKYRDALKLLMTDGNVAYCILGIENQSDVHYALPVKNGVYDFLQLAHQVTETANSHKAEAKREKEAESGKASPKPTKAEYLSGFHKSDRLLPVITLAVSYSAEPWDGPLSLREMYSTEDEGILRYAADYRVNLITPQGLTEDEMGEFHSSLREVMLYIKYSKDKEKLWEVTQKDKGFQCLERQAAEVINVITNSRLKYPEGEEVVDMCLALKEMIEDAVKEKDSQIQERDSQIQEKDSQIQEKDSQIKEQNEKIKKMGEENKKMGEENKKMEEENKKLKELLALHQISV